MRFCYTRCAPAGQLLRWLAKEEAAFSTTRETKSLTIPYPNREYGKAAQGEVGEITKDFKRKSEVLDAVVENAKVEVAWACDKADEAVTEVECAKVGKEYSGGAMGHETGDECPQGGKKV